MRGYKYNLKVILNVMSKRGWTVKELSNATGMDVGDIYKITNGSRTGIYLKTANKIAKALGLEVSDIIEI